MADDLFPTFNKWLNRHGKAQDGFDLMRWFRRRGPAWRVSTWWPGDTRQAQQHSLVRILSVAHRERLELTPMVENLADEHRGSYRRILRRLARRLASGIPVVDALEQTSDVLSDSVILAIRFGSQSGTLASTYQQLLDSRLAELGPQHASVRHLVYYWMVPAAALIALGLLATLIIAPTFREISGEFGIAESLPRTFVVLDSISQALIRYAVVWLIAALAVGWLILSGPSRRFFRRAIATRIIPSVAQLRSVELLRLFASALDAGRPLPGAFSTLARYHFDKHVRQKLLYARNEVEQGVDVWTSLVDAKLLTVDESDALAKASSNTVRSWTLRRLASWKLATLRRKTAILLAFLHPLIVLLFGAVVLWICFALFSFLAFFITSVE